MRLARHRLACGCVRDDTALGHGQTRRRLRQPRVQPVVQLVARHWVGELAGACERKSAKKLMRGTPRGHDDERADTQIGVSKG
jgi:hypothetical protein